MKITAAAIQMPADPGEVASNVERADALLRRRRDAGASLAVLPEMFNTGYGLIPCYAEMAEPLDGPTMSHLARRAREWQMLIAAGFVERDGHQLYDSLALVSPDGSIHAYRKRHLVFWEPFRFGRGREPLVVNTRWGRIGLAICADIIHRKVWDDYRDRIDVALVAAAWPDFTCQRSGKKNWLFGQLGPHAGTIPGLVAKDLGIPVVFANQCGPTRTVIPYIGTWLTAKIADRFAGMSCVCDGHHADAVTAREGEDVAIAELTIHPPGGPRSWHIMSRSESEASSSTSATVGSSSWED